MLDKRLPVPAYDHLLKLSHTFNLLDARGAVGMTERAECFATMRHLARQVTGEQLLDAPPEGLHAFIIRSEAASGTLDIHRLILLHPTTHITSRLAPGCRLRRLLL